MIDTRRQVRRPHALAVRRRQSRPRRQNLIDDVDGDSGALALAAARDADKRRSAAPRLKLQSRAKRRADQPANIRDGHGDEKRAVNRPALVQPRLRRRGSRAARADNSDDETLRHIYAAGKRQTRGVFFVCGANHLHAQRHRRRRITAHRHRQRVVISVSDDRRRLRLRNLRHRADAKREKRPSRRPPQAQTPMPAGHHKSRRRERPRAPMSNAPRTTPLHIYMLIGGGGGNTASPSNEQPRCSVS